MTERDLDAETVSDGKMRCPVTRDGLPCQKHIPKGWTVSEGHGGGHWFQTDESFASMFMAGAHYDATAALSGQPFTPHTPADCPDLQECRRKGWTP